MKALVKPGLHGDGRTLCLSVSDGGSRSWIQRITLKGRRRARVPTFREAAEQTYQALRPRMRSEKVVVVSLQSMER